MGNYMLFEFDSIQVSVCGMSQNLSGFETVRTKKFEAKSQIM
jgi:hypothetical protein